MKIATLLLGLSFTSCSDDDKDDSSKLLTYKGSQMVAFKMYVGSPTRGKEVNTAGLDPKKYWEESITWKENTYGDKNLSFKFVDNENMAMASSTKNLTYKYKFNADTLFLYSEKYSEWDLFGFGNKTQIVFQQGLTKCVYNRENSSGSSMGNDDQDVNSIAELLERSVFSTLEDMKSVNDTLMYCNIHYTFK